jgi:hypothetical protein
MHDLNLAVPFSLCLRGGLDIQTSLIDHQAAVRHIDCLSLAVLAKIIHTRDSLSCSDLQAAMNGHRTCIKALARLHASVEAKSKEVSFFRYFV